MTKTTIPEVYNILSGKYTDIFRREVGYGLSWWPAKDVTEMMVGAILTQNTNWKNVEKALINFNDNLTPQFILSRTHDELVEIIRPSGFYNQKAERLKLLMEWFSTYHFDPSMVIKKDTKSLREELLAIKGVGRETADSILVYGFGKPSFVIDAYTKRIFSRLGFEVPKDYDAFRAMFEESVENNILTYDHYHGYIVEHAKEFCRKKPFCAACPLKQVCVQKLV